jgi:hypothetical protein
MNPVAVLARAPRQLAVATLGFLVLFGILNCFFGQRVFRVLLGIIGFMAGAALLGAVGYDLFKGQLILVLLAAVVGGLLGALVLVVLYLAGVFVVGAQLGYLVGAAAYSAAGWKVHPAVLLIPAVLAGVLAVVLQKFIIVLATSFAGAWIVLVSAFALLEGVPVLNLARDPLAFGSIVFICWLVLGVLGVFIQYALTSGPAEGEEPAAVD